MLSVVHEARQAEFILKNINLHVNHYTSDCTHIGWLSNPPDLTFIKNISETLKILKTTIKNFPLNMELHEFGYIDFKDIPEVEMKTLDVDDFKEFQLIVFNHYMVTVEHFWDKRGGEGRSLFQSIRKRRQKRYSNYLKIKDFVDISDPKKVRQKWMFELKAFDAGNLQVDKKKSLSFRFSKEPEAKMLHTYFKDLLKKLEDSKAS